MLTLLETLGESLAPLLPFVTGKNAALAITCGLLMTGCGLLLLLALAARRFLLKGKERQP